MYTEVKMLNVNNPNDWDAGYYWYRINTEKDVCIAYKMDKVKDFINEQAKEEDLKTGMLYGKRVYGFNLQEVEGITQIRSWYGLIHELIKSIDPFFYPEFKEVLEDYINDNEEEEV